MIYEKYLIPIKVQTSLNGVMVKLLALLTRDCEFDTGLLQSFGCDFKPRFRLRMTFAVGGT